MTFGRKVLSSGPLDAKIMVVGEAPGAEEEKEGRPFVGWSGQVLRDHLLGVGINPTKVRFANICKYRPPGNQIIHFFDRDGMPNEAVLEGMRELKDEIQKIKPNVIIACGNYALWALTGKGHWKAPPKRGAVNGEKHGYKGIGDWRGSIIEGLPRAGGCKVVATVHPAAVVRKWPLRVFLQLDLQRALDQSRFPEIRRPEHSITIDPRGADRLAWRDRLLSDAGQFGGLAFDIEYKPKSSNLLCVGFCANGRDAVSFRTGSGTDISFVRDILLSGVDLVAQNAAFDASILEYWFGIECMKYVKYDTMLASHSWGIELPKDLGTLTSIHTEIPCYWDRIDWKKVWAGLQPIEEVMTYNAYDCLVTKMVQFSQQKEDLKEKGVQQTFDFEMSLLQPLWEMSRRGMPVDKKRMAQIRTECEETIKRDGELLDLIAGRPVNVMSGADMRAVLFDQLGFKPTKFSAETRKASTDDYVLSDLWLTAKTPAQKKTVELIRSVRKSRSLISKFVDIEFDADGRMRSHYKIGGTTTGRLASAKFFPTGTGDNGQNRPRDKRVRSVFPADPGYTFFYNDLERAELIVVAHLSQDPVLLSKIEPGKDAHKITAATLFHKEVDEISDEERYLGKQTGHAGNYMEGWKTLQMQVNKLAAQTGVSIDAKTAKYLIGAYREVHGRLPTWWNDVKAELRAERRLYNLLGRPRTFYDRIESVLPTAIAFKPQSTVGDVLNVGLLRVWADDELRRMGLQLTGQIHDAIAGQVPTEAIYEAMARVRKLMRVDLQVPGTDRTFFIPVEVAIGPTWGECKVWKDDLLKEAA